MPLSQWHYYPQDELCDLLSAHLHELFHLPCCWAPHLILACAWHVEVLSIQCTPRARVGAERAHCAPLESQMEQVIPLSQGSWFNKPVSTPHEVLGLKPSLELRFHQQNAQHSFELFSVPVPHCQGILFRGQKCGHVTIKVRKSFTECVKIALQGLRAEETWHNLFAL